MTCLGAAQESELPAGTETRHKPSRVPPVLGFRLSLTLVKIGSAITGWNSLSQKSAMRRRKGPTELEALARELSHSQSRAFRNAGQEKSLSLTLPALKEGKIFNGWLILRQHVEAYATR